MWTSDSSPRIYLTRLAKYLAPALIYAALGFAWIHTTDALVLRAVSHPAQFHRFSTMKGDLFILITASVFGWILTVAGRRREGAADWMAAQQSALASMASPVAILDQAQRIVWVNPAYATLTGYAPEDLTGHPRTEFHTGPLERLPRTGAAPAGVTVHRVPCRRKDDSPYIYQATTTAVPGETGECRYLIEVGADVTAELAAADRLQSSEAKYRTLIETLHDGIWETDPSLRLTAISEGLAMILGTSPAALIGRDFAEFMPRASETAFRRLLQERRPITRFEPQVIGRDGGLVTLRLSGLPRFDTEGTFRGYQGTGDNITAESRAADALQESERQYRDLTEMLPQTIWEITRDGTFTYANQHGFQTFGYDAGAIPGLHVLDVMVPEDHDRIRAAMGRLMRGEAPGPPGEYTCRRRDGSRFPALVQSAPIYRDGVVVGARGLTIDISAQQQAAAAIRRDAQRLAAVQGVATEIAAELQLDAVLPLIIRRAVELTGGAGGNVYLWDADGTRLMPVASVGAAAGRQQTPRQLGEGAIGYVAQTRAGLIVNDYRTSPFAHPQVLAETQVVACLLEPLLSGAELLGVVAVDHETPGKTFSLDDQAMLRLFAAEAAVAIQNARLFADSQREVARRTEAEARQALYAQQLETIRRIGEELVQEHAVTPLLARTVQTAAQVVQGGTSTILLWDAEAQFLRLEARSNPTETWRATVRLQLGQGVAGEAARLRKPLTVNEYRTSPFAHATFLEHSPATAVIAIPLQVRDRFFGVLTMDNAQGLRPFTKQDETVLTLLARPVAIAIENALLFEQARQEIAQRVAAEYNLRKIEQAVAQSATAVLIADSQGRVEYVNPRFTALTGYPAETILGATGYLIPETLLSAERRAEIWATVRRVGAWRGEIENQRQDGRPYWERTTVSAVRTEQGHITHYIAVKEDITAEVAAQRAQEHHTGLVEAIQKASARISASLHLGKVLQRIAEEACTLLQTEYASVYLTEKEGTTLIGDAHAGFPMGDPPPAWADLADHVFQSRAPRIENALAVQGGTPPGGSAAPLITRLLGEPLRVAGRPVGVLLLGRAAAAAAPFTAHEQAVVALFSTHCAIAIQNAQTFAEQEAAERALAERTEVLEAVQNITAEITRELNPTTLLQLVLTRALRVLQADRGFIALWSETTHELAPQVWEGVPEAFGALRFALGEGVAGTVAQQRQGVLVPDIRTYPQAHPSVQALVDIGAAIAEPLLYRATLVGAIVLGNRAHNPRQFTATDQQFLRLLAGQAAIAIQNARLYAAAQADLVEREKAQGALQRSENQYRRLIATAEEGIALNDREFRFTYVNAKLAASLGYTPEEMLNRYYLEFVDPAERTAAQANMPGRLAGTIEPVERTFRHKDSSPRVMLVNGSVVTDDTGQQIGVLGTYTDITRRVAAEAALANRNRQLQAVQAITAEITRELNPERVLHLLVEKATGLIPRSGAAVWLWNESTQDLTVFGVSRPDAWHRTQRVPLGFGLTGAVALRRSGQIVNKYRQWPDARPETLARTQITAAMAEPLLYRDNLVGVVTVDTEDPEVTFTEHDLAMLRVFADQAAIAIQNARLFETERQRREQLDAVSHITAEITRELDLPTLLTKVAERARHLVPSSNAQIWLLHEESDTLHLEAGSGSEVALPPIAIGAGIIGQTAAQRVGITVDDYAASPLALPDCAEDAPHRAVLTEPLLFGDRLLGVLCLQRNDGPAFAPPDRTRIQLLCGHAAIAIQNARIVHNERAAYESLTRAQAELVRSEKLRALGQLSAGMAHDLNNVLAAVRGEVEILQLKHPEYRELQALMTSIQTGAQMLRRLTEFSRKEPQDGMTSVPLKTVVAEAIDMTRYKWWDEAHRHSRQITLGAEGLQGLPPVLGNASEIRDALVNLILNAVDAMPSGGTITLSGSASAATDGDQRILLRVADTGTGIPDEVRQRIFDPFFTTKGAQGTGLGLSMVYGIMQRHQGEVRVESTPGQGTTFTLEFPATAEPQAPAPVPLAVATSVPRHILVVEDQDLVRRPIVQFLQMKGHTVSEASSAQRALEVFAAAQPDLLLTDLTLNDMTGLTLAEMLRSGGATLPILLYTGWNKEINAEEEIARGTINAVLEKPVSFSRLLEAIEGLVV